VIEAEIPGSLCRVDRDGETVPSVFISFIRMMTANPSRSISGPPLFLVQRVAICR
jgi:hypothetical protein